jgi:hypothetical protein
MADAMKPPLSKILLCGLVAVCNLIVCVPGGLGQTAAPKLTTVYDVRSFGAVGDGKILDTPALQAAIPVPRR